MPAHSLRMSVTVEDVETKKRSMAMVGLQGDHVGGPFYGRPIAEGPGISAKLAIGEQ